MSDISYHLVVFLLMTVVFSNSQQANASANWHGHISVGQLTQDYHEVDNSGLTTDGVLNSESGSIPSVAFSIESRLNNTRIANTDWTPYGKLELNYATGETDYDGYLQSGSVLTPYQTTTDNKILQGSFALGASKAIKTVRDNLTITPTVAVSHHNWERNLEQYTEDFRHTMNKARTR